MAINTITFSNKSDINTSSVAETNKITSANINEIKSIVNTNANLLGDVSTLTASATSVVEAINNLGVNSTNEIKTNKVWINDKPIYKEIKKTNNCALPTTSADLPSALRPTNESLIDEFTHIEVLLKDGNYVGVIPAQVIRTGSAMRIISLDTWGALADRYITIVYEYTKTTD